ncbi:hypothetical protein [Lysobacter enzymogenes]|uniref:Uncharacterized protein n=1 Tax=Lysobacter enzymogenes TaxID=69 RepID=A0A3N2RBW0_LYSEN|nr:hypothetical protein [Lysobacter enzymogenes]ROU04885.1 hypothetical protein D9T17_22480 [Lysobacter enzymogenes]
MSALAVVRSSFGSSLLRYRRSWGLWLLLLAAPVSARYWIAGEHEAYAAIVIDGKAPVLTSAVLGLSLGIIVSMLLVLGVFVYLRSNTTRRQPWQIVETTAASRIALVFGRFGADLAVLGAALLATTLAGWILAWIVDPVDGRRPLDIALGLWLPAAPVLMMVAALRQLFDALPPTRGGFGDFAFFVSWLVALVVAVGGVHGERDFAAGMRDVFGFVRPLADVFELGPDVGVTIGRASVSAGRIAVDVGRELKSSDYIATRLAWAGISLALVLLAGIAYRPHRQARRWGLRGWIARAFQARPVAAPTAAVAAGAARWPWLGVFVAEFGLILPGRYWRALACGAALLAWTGGDFRRAAAPAIGLLLIFALSAHASRSEAAGLLALSRTAAIAPMARRALFVVAGIAWAVLLAAPAILAGFVRGDTAPLSIALAGGAVVAGVSIALGAWSRSPTPARLLLLVAWYSWMTGG